MKGEKFYFICLMLIWLITIFAISPLEGKTLDNKNAIREANRKISQLQLQLRAQHKHWWIKDD